MKRKLSDADLKDLSDTKPTRKASHKAIGDIASVQRVSYNKYYHKRPVELLAVIIPPSMLAKALREALCRTYTMHWDAVGPRTNNGPSLRDLLYN